MAKNRHYTTVHSNTHLINERFVCHTLIKLGISSQCYGVRVLYFCLMLGHISCYYLPAEGNAEILFIFYHNGNEMEAILNTNVQPKSILFKDYQVTLKHLDPYPVHQKIIFHGCYTATLIIKRIRAKTYS